MILPEKVKIVLPEDVKTIIETLCIHGHEAYAVGGCVRDTMIGREPGDWDITTSAMPEETKLLFERTFDTGIEHGTITVLLNGVGYEVTTYRIDGKYEDNRHPNEVEFTRNLKEDLLRRDFTINAMAYNDQEGLVDIFDGISDLKRGVIRCVGDAKARFGEDALRILRAVRFSAQLGYEIEVHTCEGIRELADTLRNISAERIQVEMVKLLISPNPVYVEQIYNLGISRVICPEWDAMMETTQENPHHYQSVGKHVIEALRYVEPMKMLRLAVWLHDIAKPVCKSVDEAGVAHFFGHDTKGEVMAKQLLRRWKFDNETIRVVSKLVYYHDYNVPATARSVRRAMHTMGGDIFPLYLEVHYADIMAQSIYKREEKLQKLEEIHAIYEGVLEKDECVTLKQLAVSGSDLIALGVVQGKAIGEMLQVLLDMVIENPEYNTKEYLLQEVKKRWNQNS
ncbi:MAG: HD domain-containing protein [Eubacteriales bacterium]